MDAPEYIQWLSGLGVEFDKAPDGTMIDPRRRLLRKRMHAARFIPAPRSCAAATGPQPRHPRRRLHLAIRLSRLKTAHCAGAVLLNMETRLLVAKAKTVILATGGRAAALSGLPRTPTTTARRPTVLSSATAAGAAPVSGYTAVSSHGRGLPAQIYGALVTERVRSVGAMLVNAAESLWSPLETRDVAAASIIRSAPAHGKGVKTPLGDAVWLDTPMIELKHGAGTTKKRIPRP